MTFRFPSSDHHTLRMSFLSRVMLNVWNLQNIHMMWFRTKNCSFHCSYDVYNVSLGWGKCTGDNSYDQLAQDFLADFLIWVWGCFSKPSWKQWLGRVAIPSSVALVLSYVILSSGVKWPRHIPKQQLPKSLPKNETCTSKKTTTPMFERKARSNTSSDCFFSEVYSQWFSQRGCRVSFLGGTLQPWANPTHGERLGALGRGRNLLPWVIYNEMQLCK